MGGIFILEYRWPHNEPNFRSLSSEENQIIKLHNKGSIERLFYDYAFNFKISARLLAERIGQTQNTSELDCYFFSIAFLYRHSLELILKSIALSYIKDKIMQQRFLRETFHNLGVLLQSIEKNIVIKDTEEYDWLKAYFQDINEIDKESDSFRYPFSIQYEKATNTYYIKDFFQKRMSIDFEIFVKKFEVAFSILIRYFESSGLSDESYKKYSPTLLEKGNQYRLQSVIGDSYLRNKFYPYIRAYTECGELLFRYINENPTIKNNVFLPMCYLFRNGLELAMKEILFEESSYDFQTTASLLKDSSHSFMKLWRYINGDIINHAGGLEDDETIINIEKYLIQLHKFDSASDKFRYPTDKYLAIHFKNPIKLDIKNIYNFFVESSNFFSGASSMMNAQNELNRELEAEYEAEMRSHYLDY